MQNPLFLLPALVGLVMCIGGLLLKRFPPKGINVIYGYRTLRAMKDQAHWNYAQPLATTEMLRMGALLIVGSASGLLFQPANSLALLLGFVLMFAVFGLLFIRVERALIRKFGS